MLATYPGHRAGITAKGGTLMTVDQDRLNEFLGQFVTDLGATMAAGSVVVGHRLGLYGRWPTPQPRRQSWPPAPGPTRRYVSEWLAGQAAGGYVTYDAVDRRLLDDRGAGIRVGRPEGSEPACRVRAGAGRLAGRTTHHRRIPHRRRGGLA